MAEAPPQAFPILENIDAEMVLKTVVGVTIAYVVNMMVRAPWPATAECGRS